MYEEQNGGQKPTRTNGGIPNNSPPPLAHTHGGGGWVRVRGEWGGGHGGRVAWALAFRPREQLAAKKPSETSKS